MKWIQFLFIFICLSCSSLVPKNALEARDVASLFEEVSKKGIVTKNWNIGEEYIWIITPSQNIVSSIEIYDPDLICIEENIVKARSENKIIFHLSKKARIKCKSKVPKQVRVDYQFFKNSLGDLNEEQLEAITNILKKLDEKNIQAALKDIHTLGLDDLFEKEMTLAQLSELKLKKGDYVQLTIWPQLQKVQCPSGDCELQVDIFGLLDYEKLGHIMGMNQLKYQQVPAFLFFCGSRFTAGSIYFRADEKMEFSHVIDENGFSCDVNSFLLKDSLNYKFHFKWISGDKLNTLLMGKREEFIAKKNEALHNKVESYLRELEALNITEKHTSSSLVNMPKVKGYIELWWEPFDRCEKDIEECTQRQMVMTRSRFIYDDAKKKMTRDFPLIPLGVKQNIDSADSLVAFVVRICPKDIGNFLLEQLKMQEEEISEDDFKQRVLSYEGKSCLVENTDLRGKDFDYRWLLASVPKEVEKEEVDMVVEDYRLLEKPSQKRMQQDIFQKGKIFFDIYLKNLRQREVLFKRSRIIEITK